MIELVGFKVTAADPSLYRPGGWIDGYKSYLQARFVGAQFRHEFAIAFQLREGCFRRRTRINGASISRGFSNESGNQSSFCFPKVPERLDTLADLEIDICVWRY